MTVDEIRQLYINYFEKNDHRRVDSASLLPASDPSLLFTTAGMVPFKEYFAATQKPPHTRLVSVQKCLRTTDLEEVGKTERHLSFFEMLGNFSFGDYFKKEAIDFAWDFSTNYLPFKPEDIWITIYQDDDEAFELWNKGIGVPKEKIVRLDEKDNFWGPAGETGACGPCSELYIDRGKNVGCKTAECQPGCECDRFMEYWNLVFNQFNKTAAGKFDPLDQVGIDTGAGLERLAALIQGVDSVFDTNELATIRDAICKEYGIKYEGENRAAVRVLTDHLRTLCFAISDGILPSNESRGYVLRRVLRRALLFGRRLGQDTPRLFKLVDTVVDMYASNYPAVEASRKLCKEYIEQEEIRFLKTLSSGTALLDEVIEKAKQNGGKAIPGENAFVLYDTYGFPLEMTREMAEGQGLTVETTGFDREMEKQRERGRKAWKGGRGIPVQSDIVSEFTGHDHVEDRGAIKYAVFSSKVTNELSEEQVGREVFYLVTDRTPFYAEGGGQVGDEGWITSETGSAVVTDTQRVDNSVVHVCNELEGTLRQDQEVQLKVDVKKRKALMKNHSATHLLNAALMKILGDHVKQSGSLVDPNYLRFDFTHPRALSSDEIDQIETQVNAVIAAGESVETLVLNKEEAESRGALMTFGEKYGDVVRVVEMSDFSREFCGGTHVANTADIEFFLISKEASPGAGNRRIEGLSGPGAATFLRESMQDAIDLADSLAKSGGDIWKNAQQFQARLASIVVDDGNSAKLNEAWHALRTIRADIDALQAKDRKERKKADKSKTVDADFDIGALLATGKKFGKHQVIAARLAAATLPALKQVADQLREREASSVLILLGDEGDRWNLVIATTRSYASEHDLDLGVVLKNTIAEIDAMSGGGGGKGEMAQGSGKLSAGTDVDKLLAEIATVFSKNTLPAGA